MGWSLLQSALTERIFMSTDDGLLQALNDSQRYLNFIHKTQLSRSEAEWLNEPSVTNFTRYFNSGFIESRKSLPEAGDLPPVQSTGLFAPLHHLLRHPFADCLV